MKNKKKMTFKYILVSSIILILCYIAFKGFMLIYYHPFISDIDYDKIQFNDKIVNVDKGLANTKFKNINIYIPETLVEKKYDNNSNDIYHAVDYEDVENDTSIKYLNIYVSDFNCEKFGDGFHIKNGKAIMDNYNFNDMYDVTRYNFANLDRKNNIFTPVKDIKLNYFLNICEKVISDDKNYYYLNGDYKGLYGAFDKHSEFRNEYTIDVYDEKNKQYYYIHIEEERDPYNEYPDDRRYNEVFTDKMMETILSSIYFD